MAFGLREHLFFMGISNQVDSFGVWILESVYSGLEGVIVAVLLLLSAREKDNTHLMNLP